jgi:hypothetical protein
MVSRRRSEVGRIASELGPLSERPRQRPPTILMAYLTLEHFSTKWIRFVA